LSVLLFGLAAAAFGSAAALSACSGERAALPPGVSALPALKRLSIPGLSPMPNEIAAGNFAVSPMGRIAFTDSRPADGFLVSVVDTIGRLILRTGSQGRGDNDMRSATPELGFIQHETLALLDLGSKLVMVDSLGRVVLGGPPRAIGLAVRLGSDSSDAASPGGMEVMGVKAVVRVANNSPGQRVIVDLDDPDFAGIGGVFPALASRGDLIVAGDRQAYKFHSWFPDGSKGPSWGRDLPPQYMTPSEVRAEVARRRAAYGHKLPDTSSVFDPKVVAKLKLRYFVNIAFDGEGRLWVTGESKGNTFADVFRDTVFLGRIFFDCVGPSQKISVSGAWIALTCQSDRSPIDRDLRLFRIEG
jgi:hypothetical protein